MSAERTRLSKSARKGIREVKKGLRQEIGLTQHSANSELWNKTEEILRAKLGDEYASKFAPHTRILREFFELRIGIKEGGSLDEVKKFQEKHDAELRLELKSAFIIIREVVGK